MNDAQQPEWDPRAAMADLGGNPDPDPRDAVSGQGLALPEPSWKYRRVLVFGGAVFTGFLLLLIVLALGEMQNGSALMWIAIALVAKSAIRDVTYMLAPGSEWMRWFGEMAKTVTQTIPQPGFAGGRW